MSSAMPPSSPPPSGPPSGPPSEPTTEVLSQGGGGPLPPESPPTAGGGGNGRRGLLIGGGVVGAVALAAGGVFAYTWLTGNGPQPAEALPADTLGYVSLDLDPNGRQKIEAYNTIKKFPLAKEWLDEQGLDADDDLVEKAFEEIKDECEGIDYADDIKPWLGKRFGLAAMPGEGDQPAPVAVVQVSDADAAEKGVAKLLESCPAGEEEFGGYAVGGEWLVLAENDEIADRVVADGEESSLADDDEFQRWTGEAGDAGIVTAYLSEEAGPYIGEQLGSLDDLTGGLAPELPEEGTDDSLDAATSMLEEFGGGAFTLRFDDGSLELEMAVDTKSLGLDKVLGGDQAADILAGLPDDTAGAYALSFTEGWAQQLIDYIDEASGGELDVEQFLAETERELNLDLPDDIETLLGEAAVLAVGSDINPESMFGMGGFDDVPIGLKVRGDTGDIEDVLDKIKATAPSPEEAELLGVDTDDDHLVVSPSSEYRDRLLGDGGLGDTDVYQDVVREDDAAGVLFVNFDAGGGWLERLAESDPEARENIAPLAGFGVTSWADGDVGHGVLRLTTND